MKTFITTLIVLIFTTVITALVLALIKKDKAKKNAPPDAPLPPYTNFRSFTVLTAVFIGLTTVLSFAVFSVVHDRITANIKPFSIQWQSKDTVYLKTGPEWFFYDQKKGTLNSLQAISEKDKSVLTSLLVKDEKNGKIYQSYSEAVDELAYVSNADKGYLSYCWIILLYCMTGVIGVQLRTINNFVGNACFKKEFNFDIWWPWYLLRPLLGFITGGVVFLLIDGKLFYGTTVLNGLSPVVVALAFVSGFSADDFFNMVRRISQRVFSTDADSKDKNSSKSGNTQQPAEPDKSKDKDQ